MQLEAVVVDLTQAKDQMVRVLNNTPDDRLHWSPSETARNALQIVAHSANSLGHISQMLLGTPYPAKTMAQADQEFLEAEMAYTNREDVLNLLEENFEKYVSVLQSLEPGDMDMMVTLPFELGAAPMNYMIGMGSLHTKTHTAQIEYLQTIYGDRNW